MPENTMYPGMVNSPVTTLPEGISDTIDTIGVADGTKLPDAPNIATLGTGEDAETILYGSKVANTLSSITRGFQGVARSWPAGTQIARMFTAWDYDALRLNHQAHLSDYASTATKTYYIDQTNGNDNNDGESAGTAF